MAGPKDGKDKGPDINAQGTTAPGPTQKGEADKLPGEHEVGKVGKPEKTDDGPVGSIGGSGGASPDGPALPIRHEDFPTKNFNAVYQPRIQSPEQKKAVYDEAIISIASGAKLLTDAGIGGAEAGKLALELYSRMFM